MRERGRDLGNEGGRDLGNEGERDLGNEGGRDLGNEGGRGCFVQQLAEPLVLALKYLQKEKKQLEPLIMDFFY